LRRNRRFRGTDVRFQGAVVVRQRRHGVFGHGVASRSVRSLSSSSRAGRSGRSARAGPGGVPVRPSDHTQPRCRRHPSLTHGESGARPPGAVRTHGYAGADREPPG
jgi:hypothetical protein